MASYNHVDNPLQPKDKPCLDRQVSRRECPPVSVPLINGCHMQALARFLYVVLLAWALFHQSVFVASDS